VGKPNVPASSARYFGRLLGLPPPTPLDDAERERHRSPTSWLSSDPGLSPVPYPADVVARECPGSSTSGPRQRSGRMQDYYVRSIVVANAGTRAATGHIDVRHTPTKHTSGVAASASDAGGVDRPSASLKAFAREHHSSRRFEPIEQLAWIPPNAHSASSSCDLARLSTPRRTAPAETSPSTAERHCVDEHTGGTRSASMSFRARSASDPGAAALIHAARYRA